LALVVVAVGGGGTRQVGVFEGLGAEESSWPMRIAEVAQCYNGVHSL